MHARYMRNTADRLLEDMTKKKESIEWLITIPILNVFGRLERSREGKEKEKGDTEQREI